MGALSHTIVAQTVPEAVLISPQGEISGLGKVESYHVSCQSSRLDPNKDLIGIVLYGKGGAQKWEENGMRFKSGYIYITDGDSASREFPNEVGVAHGAAYRRLTGKSWTSDMTIGGFAIRKG